VQAIDFYGASVDPVGNAWVPSAPFQYRTVQSANNTTGLINGVIRGLTASNAIITQLTNAAIAQTNGAPEQVFVHYDAQYDITIYSIETQAGIIDLQASADSYGTAGKTSINLAVGESVDNEDFLLIEAFPDADADGIPDATEDTTPNIDSDGDGTPDYLDSDSDNDGIADSIESGGVVPRDTDDDGVADYIDTDSDNDGVPDQWEVGANPNNPTDRDNDGKPDYIDANSLAYADVQVDGVLNIKDILLLTHALIRSKTLNGPQFRRADIYPPGGDDVIDSRDLHVLRQILAP